MKTLSLIVVLAIAHLLPVMARRPDVTGTALTHPTTPAWPVATTSHLPIHHADNHIGNIIPRSDSTESEESARSTITTTVMNITTTTTVYVNSSTPFSGPVPLSETDSLGIVFGTVTTTEESEIPSVPTLQASSTHTSSVMTITGPNTDTETDIMTIETETATSADSPEITGETSMAATEPEYPIPTAANSSFSQVDHTVLFDSTLSSASETFDIATATAAATATNNSLEAGQSTTTTSCSSALLTMVTPLSDNNNDSSISEPASSSHHFRPHPTPYHTTSGNTTSSTTTDTLMATATANSNAGARSLSQPVRLFGFLTRIFMLLQVNLNLDPAGRHLAEATTIDGSSTELQQSTESQSSSSATTTISTTSSTTSTTTTTLTYTSTTSVNTTSTIDLPTLPCTTNPDPAVLVTCTASASSLPYNGTVTFAYGNVTTDSSGSGGVASYNASSSIPTSPAATSSSQSSSSSTSHGHHATPTLMSGASGPGSWSESTVFHRVTPFMVHAAIVALRLWNRW